MTEVMRLSIMTGLIALLAGCGQATIKVTYPSGSIKEEYKVDDDGRKNGAYTMYYENGAVREKAHYRQDTLAGVRTLFYQNGKPEVEEPYDERGILNGPYRQYYEDGGMKTEYTYFNNVITGLLRSYYPGGKIKEEVTIVDNEENGPFTEYYQNGTVAWKGAYQDGDNEFGWLEQYDSLGQLIKVMRCDTPGICRTKWLPGMPSLSRQ